MRPALTSFAALISLSATQAAYAHGGHGPGGAHWHATDGLIFVALAVAIGAALWLSKGGE